MAAAVSPWTNLPPFVNDAALLGRWQSVDFVGSIEQFDPSKPSLGKLLASEDLTFLEAGRTSLPWFRWTKGELIPRGSPVGRPYELRQVGGRKFLFVEWPDSLNSNPGGRPRYLVLRPAP